MEGFTRGEPGLRADGQGPSEERRLMEPGCTATDAAVVQLVQRRNMRPLWIGFLVLARGVLER